ncbi:MAG: M48 family metalloprotease [Pseudomonadota bacterium]
MLFFQKKLSLLVIIFFSIGMPLSAYKESNAKEILLPDIGASSSVAMSSTMEDKIGRSVINQLRASHGIIDDLELSEYINNLGYSLVEQTEDNLQPFHFFLLNSHQINAFATPGGVVAVYSGLFLTSDSESELASVLAHEIAHVTQHHIARAFEKASQMNLPMTLGLIAAILLGATGAPEAGLAAATGIQAIGTQAQINFTRANEKEADRVGIKYLFKANYNPYGMNEFFQKLHQKNRYTGKNYPEFLMTHPVTSDRISESIQRADLYYKKSGKNNSTYIKADKSYRLMKGKLLVLTSQDMLQLENYYKQLSDNRSISKNPEFQYTYAHTLLHNNKIEQAILQFKQLHEMEKSNLYFINGYARALLSSQKKIQKQQGLKLLQTALQQHPLNKILSAHYASALIATNNFKQSIQFINDYNKHSLKHPVFYQLLSRAYGKQGKLLDAHLAHGEYYYLNGQYEQAIMQLRLAKKYAKKQPKDSFYILSKLDSRLLEIEQEKKKYKLEEK